MQSVKIVITGPFAAGKTTFIKTISEISVISTERPILDPKDRQKKDETTVAMDFGRITISDEVALYLFGTPGQERFSFMWETLSQGMLGFVILVDLQDKEGWNESRKMLGYFRNVSQVPYVVAVNKVERQLGSQSLEKVRKELSLDGGVPVLYCDARDKQSVKTVLLSLLDQVLDRVESRKAELL